ncbi:hypothetical protein [Hydrogenophaga sp.]|uniref:hypothetical protein n=1 Tax=Hydrogenophaga sp. TaxID=1904254 RepID=UPI0025BFA1F2|nr:hypothetical protein [Hydrogenophaga sp.]
MQPSSLSLSFDIPLRRWGGWVLVGLALVFVSGCASVYRVDSQVESFARWSGPAPAAAASAIPQPPQVYRFDRLPSQASEEAVRGQTQLEALARVALAKQGWSLADAGVSPPWTVRVSAGTLKLPRAPWEDPWDGYWGGYGFPGRDYVVTGRGQVIWAPVFIRMDMPYYQRKVALLISRADNGQVVYETQAAHDGRWNSSSELWGAMFDAALQDFPTPPGGLRQVNIDLPR